MITYLTYFDWWSKSITLLKSDVIRDASISIFEKRNDQQECIEVLDFFLLLGTDISDGRCIAEFYNV